MTTDADELLQLVREDGTRIGSAPRHACHGNPDLLHSVARVLIFDGQGGVLLQLRSETKDCFPGYWDTSSAGHLQVDEAPEDGARRELAEELGIVDVELMFLHQRLWRGPVESELAYTYAATYAGPVTPDPAEVAETRIWTEQEIADHLGTHCFTPGFEDEWRLYCTHRD